MPRYNFWFSSTIEAENLDEAWAKVYGIVHGDLAIRQFSFSTTTPDEDDELANV